MGGILFVFLFGSMKAYASQNAVAFRCQQLWAERFQQPAGDFRFLAQYRVLLVPGFLSDAWGEKPFKFQKRALKQIGATYEKVRVHSAAHIAVNAEIVAASIEQSDRPVLLLTHSKGALDTLHALITRPSLIEKVGGWIILQSPIYGACLADLIHSYPLVDRSVKYAVARCGGSPDVIGELTSETRKRYMAEHAQVVSSLGKQFPILNVTTEVRHEAPLSSKNYDLTGRLIWSRMGKNNDGVVAVDETFFPNAESVRFSDIDHGGIVNSSGDAYDAESLTYVLLRVLGDRLMPSSGPFEANAQKDYTLPLLQ